MRILIIGSYPPPHGGISTHIRNLQTFLERQGDTVVVIDIGRQRKIPRPGCMPVSGGWDMFWKVLTQARRASVVHIHAGFDNTVSRVLALTSWIFAFVARRRCCTIFTIHSGKAVEYFHSLNGVRRLLFRNLFRWTPSVVTVNTSIQQSVQEIIGDPKKRIPVIPAFSIDSSFLSAEIPAALAARIEIATPLISCVIFLEPDYGAEDVLELSYRLKDNYPRHLIIVMGTGKESKRIREKRNAMSLENHVWLIGNLPQEVCLQVMSRSRLFLRPTRFDGDANSVREALTLSIPVVATRTDFRPPGVLLYSSGDVTALEELVRTVLDAPDNQPTPEERHAQVVSFDNNLRQVRQIYTEILNQ